MSAYYNEFDPQAAQWLRNLIAAELIAPGDVDERSITDVSISDLIGYTQCHFFAGIGGWSLAARIAGWPDDRPLWTGSCPCQPFSVAGKGKGAADERHLWPDFFRLVRAGRPDVVMGEQVAAAVGKDWLDGVLSDLEGIGYVGGAAVVPACAVNAPHRRDRLWFVAGSRVLGDSQRAGLEGLTGHDRAASGRPIEDRSTAEAGYGGAVEHANQSCASEERQQPGGEFGRLGGDPLTRAGGDVADSERQRIRGSGPGAPAAAPGRMQGADQERQRFWSDARADGVLGGSLGQGGDSSCHVADSDGSFGGQGREVICWSNEGSRALARAGLGGDGSFWSNASWIIGHDGKARRVEPSIRLLVDGLSPWVAGSTAGSQTKSRQVALKGFGNAIVPEVAAEVMVAWMEVCS